MPQYARMKNFWQTLPKPILALAPMEGVTDLAFRTVCKQAGADVVYTEFVSADAIAHGAKKILNKLKFHDAERPIVAQIFGHDIQAFAYAAQLVEKLGFDGLDINLGCPARKVVNHGSGAALLRDPEYARQLITAAMEATKLPVSLKIRASIRKSKDSRERVTALDFIRHVNDLPIAAIMVHGRSYEDGHGGTVDADMIRQVKAEAKAPVLANGGIFCADNAQEMLIQTKADGLGIARGSWGHPWIFSEIKAALSGSSGAVTAWDVQKNIILDHARLIFEDKGAHGLLEFRKHLVKYISGRPHAAEFRRRAVGIVNLTDIETLLNDIDS